jgi:FAD/FMN-containing dehydrogenase
MDAATTQAFVRRLAERSGPLGLIAEPAEIDAYTLDWRKEFKGQALAVARPRTVDDVAAVVRLCGEAGVAIVPQGGNTGLAGGAVPVGPRAQIVLSFTRMNAIRSIDPVGLTVEAEAGCVLQTIQEAALAVGRELPVSFAAEGSAQIGGVIACNAGGVNVLRYGMVRNRVLGIEAVLADGTVVSGLRRLHKDNAGYDWKQLFIGTEGTLGLITAAVLGLVPKPRHQVTALLSVSNPRAALRLLDMARGELGDTITAFELMSATSFELIERHLGLKSPITGAGWFVLIEASASLAGLRDASETTLGAALEAGDAVDGVVAESAAQAAKLWALREHITEAERLEGPSAKHDVSVPVVVIPDFIEKATQALERDHPGARLNLFGHIGDGNLHFNVIKAPGQSAEAINRTVHDVVAAHGGSISAEHGIGQYRVDELRRYKSSGELALMRRMKAALDPKELLNPGKVLAAG